MSDNELNHFEHEMQNDFDCGPECVKTITGKSREEVKSVFAWKDSKSLLDNFLDMPLHHFVALEKLGYKVKIVTDKDIINGTFPLNSVVVLLHSKERPTLEQHWVVFSEKINNRFKFLFGVKDKLIAYYAPEGLRDVYRRGFPNCAYTVVLAENADPNEKYYELTKWEKTYVSLTKTMVTILTSTRLTIIAFGIIYSLYSYLFKKKSQGAISNDS
jgi:hypothetical protein